MQEIILKIWYPTTKGTRNHNAEDFNLSVISHVVLYGCETWSLTPRVELRFRVFENRIPKRIFGPKRAGEG
jgi:hypothetical protein